MRRESEKEWYYGNADKERLGPYSFDEVTFNVNFLILSVLIAVLSATAGLPSDEDCQITCIPTTQ